MESGKIKIVALIVTLIALMLAFSINSCRNQEVLVETVPAVNVAPKVLTSIVSWENVAEAIQPSVVKIYIGPWEGPDGLPAVTAMGSGFVIDSKGTIVSCAHVVAAVYANENSWMGVEFADETRFLVKSAISSLDHDVAIIKLNLTKRDKNTVFPFLKFRKEPIKIGLPILTMGSDGLVGWYISSGIVSSLEVSYPEDLTINYYQGTPTVTKGNSGGPTVDIMGELVGMTAGFRMKAGGTTVKRLPGLSLFVPNADIQFIIKDLLEGNGAPWTNVNI